MSTITGNTSRDNLGDYGIVVSGKNAGGEVANTTVSNNTVIGFNPPADVIPGVGGIVLGVGAVGPSTVTNTMIVNNNVSGGFLPGISLHSFGSGKISGTQISGNVLSDNGSGEFSGQTTGVEIFASGPTAVISGIQVAIGNTFSNDYYTVWGHDTVNDVPASSNLSIGLTIGGLAGVLALVILRRSRKSHLV